MLDEVVLNFNPASLLVLNIILGVVMFGVALDLRIDDFKRVAREPRSIIVGLIAQLIALPMLTWALVYALEPQPSIALGMMLVAACPGGNMSNFFTHLSRGNTGLSISMTSVVTLLAVIATPFNFQFWASMYGPTSIMLKTVALDPVELSGVLFLLLGLPLGAGMWIRHTKSDLAARMVPAFRTGSILVFALFIVLALANNWTYFKAFVGTVFVFVLIHNALALTTGFGLARLAGLPNADRRALTIEVGIQNSGLALVIIFSFFGGLGGMAIVAAWWGVWHLVAGMMMAMLWRRKAP